MAVSTSISDRLLGTLRGIAVKTDNATGFAYSASKFFVRRYAAANVRRFAARGARVNSISPGVFQTFMTACNPAANERFATSTPVPRYGRLEEIVATVQFLNSTSFVTGAEILVDGGAVAGAVVPQVA